VDWSVRHYFLSDVKNRELCEIINDPNAQIVMAIRLSASNAARRLLSMVFIVPGTPCAK